MKRIVFEHPSGLRQILGHREVRNIADCPRHLVTEPLASEFVADEKRYVLYRAASSASGQNLASDSAKETL